jgi:Ras-related protein Rab-18
MPDHIAVPRRLQGIIYAYDITRRETFESVQETWMKEVEAHANVENSVKMIVANKVWILTYHYCFY